ARTTRAAPRTAWHGARRGAGPRSARAPRESDRGTRTRPPARPPPPRARSPAPSARTAAALRRRSRAAAARRKTGTRPGRPRRARAETPPRGVPARTAGAREDRAPPWRRPWLEERPEA